MDRIEIQRKLYDARNAYLKAKKEMEFQQHEIAFLKECEDNLKKGRTGDWMFNEMFGPEPLTGFIYGD
jgi:hypothetical protein